MKIPSAFSGRRVLADRTIRRFVLVTLVDSVGSGMFLTASVLFLTRWAGLTPGQIGTGLSVSAVVALLLSVPITVAAERLGVVRALVLLQVWRGAWFLAYLAVDTFPAYLVVCCMLGLALRVIGPITQSVVAAATPKSDRVTTMAMMRSVQNAGFGVGAFAGTLVIGAGSRAALAGPIAFTALSLFAAAALLRGLSVDVVPAASIRGSSAWRHLRSLRDGRYLLLTVLSGVLVLHMTLLTVGLPLWIVEHTQAPPAVVGVCLLANTVLVVLLQVRASRGCDDVGVAGRRMVLSGAALAVFCVLLAVSGELAAVPATGVILLAAITLTLAELWHSAGAWGISFELAPTDRRTEYLAVFNLGTILQGIVGPPLVTALVLPLGTPGWLMIGIIFLVAAAAVPAVTRRPSPQDSRAAVE
ncbi:MFS transporter [Streptomyces rubiginosohelvolus]